jgi:carbon monoxide dehydrogenase subunit G
MPGATVEEFDGEVVTGRIKIKVGPVSLTYRGTAKFTERDPEAHVVVIEASGKETRGAGTASATVRASLEPESSGQATKVTIHTTMNVTGRPAQFGRGVMAEVSGRVIEKFATNLAAQLSGGAAAPAASTPAATAAASTDTERQSATAAASSPGEDQAPDQAAVPIEDLNLPVRSYNSLRRKGVATVGSLTALSEQDLLAIDGLGPASVKEIRQRLADRGLSLGTVAGANGGTSATPASTAGAATPASAAGAASTASATTPAAGPSPLAGRVADQDLAAANGLLPPQGARPPDEDALDLLSVAGLPLLKRVLPAIGVALFGAVLFGLLRRRRRRARS